MDEHFPLTLLDIRHAHRRIESHVVRTPALTVEVDDDLTIIAKPESLQPIGAFKLRGAFSMMTEPSSTAVEGVVAHSSGNHAQAVARAAKVLGKQAVIVMPSNAPPLKRRRVEADGAEIVTVGPDSEERRLEAERLAKQRGWLLVPPYDHPLVAAGQGTAALELVEDVGTFDRFYCPMSGGGLMAGCATVVAELTDAEIIGVEPDGADDTAQSLAAGERVAVPPPDTIADGLRVRIPGEWTWSINRDRVDRVELVGDDEMLAAMRWAMLRLRLILEPSGAASLAVALREGVGRCAVLLSGGNASPELLAEALNRPG